MRICTLTMVLDYIQIDDASLLDPEKVNLFTAMNLFLLFDVLRIVELESLFLVKIVI